MNGNDDFSLYIHIPFCKTRCPYCHFYVVKEAQGIAKERQKDELLAALHQELILNKHRFPSHKKITSIYWGGGTPALFGPLRVRSFLDMIKMLLPSMDTHDQEITLEANPESINLPLLCQYKEAGINRLSLGVQSFQQKELELLGRSHGYERIEEVIYWARAAGIDNISIDLMYDLPHQTLDIWTQSLQSAFVLPISHISLYNLTIEPKTAFFKLKEKFEKVKPSDEISLAMYNQATSISQKNNFYQYEISAFAKPGKESRHNIGYWTGREFYGFGPAAYSFLDTRRFSNIANLPRYISSILSGTQEYEEIDSVCSENRARELFCIGLRLLAGVDLDAILQQLATQLPQDFYTALSHFIENEYIVVSFSPKTIYALSTKGRLVYDSIASELI